jgi:heptaprenyl diphosphate synthase
MKYIRDKSVQKPKKPRIAAKTALLIVFALITYVMESAVPPLVPGMAGARLGLANVFVLYALLALGPGPAIALVVFKGLLGPVLAGSPVGIYYSLAGGALALTAMAVLKKSAGFGIAAISAAGAFFHNLGQCILASILLGAPSVLLSFPAMAALSVPLGIITGLLCAAVIRVANRSPQPQAPMS